MFAQMLKAQWTQSRLIVVTFAVLAFGAPLTTVVYGGALPTSGVAQVSQWLYMSRTVGQVIPIVALALGVLLGMSVWSADHAGRHVYALSLPVARWQFVLLRFANGMTLLAVPVAGLGVGALIASAVIDLPSGVHAYPVQLTLRFALSATVMFGIFFAISIATKRAVLLTLGTIGAVVLADVVLSALSLEPVVVSTMYRILTHWPGPLAILTGRWALFDV